MINFKVLLSEGSLIGHINLDEEVVLAVEKDPELITIRPTWILRDGDVKQLAQWYLYIDASLPVGVVHIPDFVGPHNVELMNGQIETLDLVGAVYDTGRHPIYLHEVNGAVYNYQNIIATKKRNR